MSANGTKTIVWSNGEDTFCIAKVGLLLDLEEKCNAGVAEIMRRLEGGTWRLNDVRETVRLGLIGGGMDPVRAMVAVKSHVDGRPLAQSVLLAYEILAAALVGVPGDETGKKPGAEAVAPASSEKMADSADQPLSDSGRDLNGTPDKSSNAPSGNSPQPSTATMHLMAANLHPTL
jgi:hypothetical protein